MGHDLRPPTFPKLPILLHRILGQNLVQIDLKTDKDLCWSKSQRETERERELPTRLTLFLKWATLIVNIQMMLGNTHKHTTFSLSLSLLVFSFLFSSLRSFSIVPITFMALFTTPPSSPYKILSFFSVLLLLMLPYASFHFHLPSFFLLLLLLLPSFHLPLFPLHPLLSSIAPTLLLSGQYRSQPSVCHIT